MQTSADYTRQKNFRYFEVKKALEYIWGADFNSAFIFVLERWIFQLFVKI